MSTNCIRCVKRKRTGTDLLCDECRELDNTIDELSMTLVAALREIYHGHASLQPMRTRDPEQCPDALVVVVAHPRALELIEPFEKALAAAGIKPVKGHR